MTSIMLQWWGGFNFADLLNQLEAAGFFSYIFPLLLIFAVVYAVLSQIKIFKDNRGAAVIVAIAAAFLALQLNLVSAFFQEIFPKIGIGIAILIAALILAGAFISDENSFKWIFFGLGALVFLFILGSSVASSRFTGWDWWTQYGQLIIFLLVFAGVIVAVTVGGSRGGAGGGH